MICFVNNTFRQILYNLKRAGQYNPPLFQGQVSVIQNINIIIFDIVLLIGLD